MQYDGIIMIVSGLVILAVLGVLLPSTNKED
jgi:hypothetical protein